MLLSELLRIGQLEGPEEYLFSNLVGGLLLDDGSFVVADHGAFEVRRFSSSGRLLVRHGREGQGPGEYEYIRALGRCDPVGFTVFDLHWQLNSYDAQGEFLGSRTMLLGDGSSPYQLACSPNGRFAVTNWDRSSHGTVGVYSASAQLRLLHPDGSLEHDLGDRIGSERFGTASGNGPHPFGRTTHIAFDGNDLIVADGAFLGYERWSPGGSLVEIVRVEVAPLNVDSLVDAFAEAGIRRIESEGGADVENRIRAYRDWAGLLEGLQSAAHLRNMRVAHGHVLIQEQAISANSARWLIFADDGTPLGVLGLPAGAKLLDMDDTRALVAETDETGVPQVVLYGIARNE